VLATSLFVSPGCWCHLLALLSALLSIGCVSSAIMGVAEPAELVQVLQRIIAASQRRKVLRLGEAANALSNLIIDPVEPHSFAVDQDTLDDLTLITNGLLAQDGVVFDNLFGIVTRLAPTEGDDRQDDSDEAEVPPGANLRPPRVVHRALHVSGDGLDEMMAGVSEGVLYGRVWCARHRCLHSRSTSVRISQSAPLPSAIGVVLDEGDAEQYWLVS
jgi:hypothetical protein